MKTIQECLMTLKKDDQVELSCRLGLEKLHANAKKADWAAHIEQGMLAEPERMRLLLRLNEIDAVRERLARGGVSMAEAREDDTLQCALETLELCGLACRAAGEWYIRDCVGGMLDMDDDQLEEHRMYDIIADLIEGWLLHVGMMPVFRLIDWIVADMFDEEAPTDELHSVILAVLLARRGMAGLYPDDEEQLWAVHPDVEEPERLLQRLREPHIAALDYPAFEADALIFSAAYTHLPGDLSVYEPLAVWLKAHNADEEQCVEAFETLVYLAQNDDAEAAMDAVMEIVPPRNLKDTQRCAGAMQQVVNRLPRWDNKGHSAETVHRMLQEKRKAAAMPGRNDPCSCGSGKKYKHCCGRFVN